MHEISTAAVAEMFPMWTDRKVVNIKMNLPAERAKNRFELTPKKPANIVLNRGLLCDENTVLIQQISAMNERDS